MQSSAKTPAEYIAQLPNDRRVAMRKIRAVLRKHLPRGFKETMAYGMIAYVVPQSLYPNGYHAKPDEPLPFISLASQKQHIGLYHMGVYINEELFDWLKQQWPKHSQSRFDMGKSCLRLKKIDQIPYELIGQLAQKMSVKDWIEQYEESLRSSSNSRS